MDPRVEIKPSQPRRHNKRNTIRLYIVNATSLVKASGHFQQHPSPMSERFRPKPTYVMHIVSEYPPGPLVD